MNGNQVPIIKTPEERQAEAQRQAESQAAQQAARQMKIDQVIKRLQPPSGTQSLDMVDMFDLVIERIETLERAVRIMGNIVFDDVANPARTVTPGPIQDNTAEKPSKAKGKSSVSP